MWKAALVCVALLLGACRSEDAPRPTRVSDLAPSPVDLTQECPEPATDLPYPPGAKLPDGAVVVRACRAAKEYPWKMPTVPHDALIRDPDRVVALVNSLEPVPHDIACTMQGGIAMDLWFGYPGGRAAALHVDTGGCGWTFTSARGDWNQGAVDGPVDPLTEFQNALLDQREHRKPPRRSWPRPRCNPSMQTRGLVQIRPGSEFASGVFCTLAADGLRWRSTSIPRALLDRISADLRDNGEAHRCRGRWSALKLETVWGERVDLDWNACFVRYSTPGGSGTWVPSSSVRRAVEALPLGPPYWQRRPNGSIVR